jgi:hypothetical protein
MFTSHNNYPPARQPFINSARSYRCRADFLMFAPTLRLEDLLEESQCFARQKRVLGLDKEKLKNKNKNTT